MLEDASRPKIGPFEVYSSTSGSYALEVIPNSTNTRDSQQDQVQAVFTRLSHSRSLETPQFAIIEAPSRCLHYLVDQ